MGFKDGVFDIVAVRFAPHHFADIERGLEQMCRVLKPGGRLYIIDCSSCNDEEGTGDIINHIERLRDSSHVYSYTEPMWRDMLGKLPLAIERMFVGKGQYALQQWFERMNTPRENRDEIFRLLHHFSEKSRELYPFGDDHLATYHIEILAKKI
jgi:ubiquinone/menaquinone biosynthesis C-methylase UbiE